MSVWLVYAHGPPLGVFGSHPTVALMWIAKTKAVRLSKESIDPALLGELGNLPETQP